MLKPRWRVEFQGEGGVPSLPRVLGAGRIARARRRATACAATSTLSRVPALRVERKPIDTPGGPGRREALDFGGIVARPCERILLMLRPCIALLLAAASVGASAQVGVSVSV